MASHSVAAAFHPQMTYAGLGPRISAHLIDLAIAFTVILASGFLLRYFRTLGLWTVPEAAQDPVAIWHALPAAAQLAVVLAFVISKGSFYSGFFQASAWQASIGKRLLGLYVTDTAGKRLGLIRSLSRSFAKDFFNALPFLGAASVATIAATGKRQALHDYAARTVVQKGRPPEGGALGLWRIVVGFGIQSLWYIATMVAVFRTLR